MKGSLLENLMRLLLAFALVWTSLAQHACEDTVAKPLRFTCGELEEAYGRRSVLCNTHWGQPDGSCYCMCGRGVGTEEKVGMDKTLKFSITDLWVRDNKDGTATVGMSEHYQGVIGDILTLDLPNLNKKVSVDDDFAHIYAVEESPYLWSPVTGEIIEINEKLEDEPWIINEDPYGAGWIVKIRLSDASELNGMRDAEEYAKFIKENPLGVSNPLPEEKSVGGDICAGKSCSECLDGTDYACAFYDGKCILSESMKNPADYAASKFVWSSGDCTDGSSYEKEDICAGKGCGECLDGTDYACAFYDGKCILSESMKNPADYATSKFVWSSGDCPVAEGCEDISIMDGDSTCGGLAAILGDLCNFDYGAPGAPCACMCEVTYSVTSGGKCITLNGEDPKYQYEHGKGGECEELCTARNDCFGYSISGYDNCLLWLQRDIMGGGDDWAGADCHIKDERAVGNDQCAHINDGNKKYACNRYYKYIAKCDICQDDDSGAVDNSAINDAIPKRERAVGDAQCAHINEDNADTACNPYYKNIAKCDICQDDDSGAVDNSAINDAIPKRERAVGDAQCAHINDGNKKYACNRYYKYIAKCDICQDDDSGAVDNSAINDAIRKRAKTKEKQVGERGAGHDWRERTHQGSGTTFTGSFGRPRGQEKAVGAQPIISCSGNVGEDYNCNECYDGSSKKYLWGSACQAKNWGADTYTKGVCGKEYKCFTKGEDIGDCPYGEYCPSV